MWALYGRRKRKQQELCVSENNLTSRVCVTKTTTTSCVCQENNNTSCLYQKGKKHVLHVPGKQLSQSNAWQTRQQNKERGMELGIVWRERGDQTASSFQVSCGKSIVSYFPQCISRPCWHCRTRRAKASDTQHTQTPVNHTCSSLWLSTLLRHSGIIMTLLHPIQRNTVTTLHSLDNFALI